jgi:pimeloyl-ACP methyl ester carboxylesterase
LLSVLTGCAASPEATADIAAIYNRSAQTIGAERNPVIVIPGILGSTLVEEPSGRVVWGAFVHGAVDTDFPEGARVFSLPMQKGVPLSELRDDVKPDGVLETLEADIGIVRVAALEPYKGIIRSLDAGRYVDRDIVAAKVRREPANAVDYAGLHTTCYQFDYDWRRDISENAARLHELIENAAEFASRQRKDGTRAKVDIVAHSMGGLVALYYLKYGKDPLPGDGSVPELTWAGAANVEQVIIVGTPSAGSVLSLKQLIEGVNYAAITPTYSPAILGTMPSIYQLMTRSRHRTVVDAASGEPVGDLFDVATWKKYGWGLAAPKPDRTLAWMLPDASEEERRAIALEHLDKCLQKARQLHDALDRPATTPDGLELHLIAGDAVKTPAVLEANAATGRVRVREMAPGDGTVTRASVLLDERLDGGWTPRLRTPLRWSSVRFLPHDHIGLTDNAAFTDDVLYLLLEKPRDWSAIDAATAHTP